MNELQYHIIELAATKFNQFGIRSVSVHDICSELRISKKTFYRFFSTKEELVAAVLEREAAVAAERFERICRGKNAIDSLIAIIKDIRQRADEPHSPLSYDLEKYYAAVYSRHEEKQALLMQESFAANLRQGIAEGYYREDLDIELSAMFHVFHLKNSYRATISSSPKITKGRLIDFYINVIVRLITNEKGLKYVEQQIGGENRVR